LTFGQINNGSKDREACLILREITLILEAEGETQWAQRIMMIMTTSQQEIHCVGCGALVPDIDGPTHRYMVASPGCWALFGEVVAREFSDFRYARVHLLTVNAYALQHPGSPSPQTIHSIAIHLISLYLVFERRYELQRATKAMQRAASHKSQFRWLDPPASFGAISIVEIYRAKDAARHVERVEAWARAVWNAWEAHHETVRRWAEL
jgi:hypothetical protein